MILENREKVNRRVKLRRRDGLASEDVLDVISGFVSSLSSLLSTQLDKATISTWFGSSCETSSVAVFWVEHCSIVFIFASILTMDDT